MDNSGDYIPREAAVKAAQDGADEWDGGYNRNRDSYIECAIDEVPAADVRPVVLCRDCMMWQYCKVAQYLGEDGFCSNGEKREES